MVLFSHSNSFESEVTNNGCFHADVAVRLFGVVSVNLRSGNGVVTGFLMLPCVFFCEGLAGSDLCLSRQFGNGE